jgi:hypothetical protein
MVNSTFPLLWTFKVKNNLFEYCIKESAPVRVMEFKVSGFENDMSKSMLMKYRRPFKSVSLELIKVINKIKNKTFDIFIIIKIEDNDLNTKNYLFIKQFKHNNLIKNIYSI